MPELEEEELDSIQRLVISMDEKQTQLFSHAYRAKRKEPETILVASVIGLISVPGLQRFLLGQIGLGFLYLFTGGLLLIGSLVDLVRYKKLTLEYNQKVAEEVAARIINMQSFPES